jgi:hypothetical protein
VRLFADSLGAPIHPMTLTVMFAALRKTGGHPDRDVAHPASHRRDYRAQQRHPGAHRGRPPRRRPRDRPHDLRASLPQSDQLAAERIAEVLAGVS